MSSETTGRHAAGSDDESIRPVDPAATGSTRGDDRVVGDASELEDPYGSEDLPSRPSAAPANSEAAAYAYADRAPGSGPAEEPASVPPADGSSTDESTPPTGRRAVKKQRPPRKSHWWEFPVLALVAVLVAILVKSFLVQPFYIPSQSMEKTLHGCPGCNGDKILVNKVVYRSRDPHPGEIIVFRAPDGWEQEATVAPSTNAFTGALRSFGQLVGVVPPDEKDLVKRVIAVGGQTVKCCDAQGRVQISDNGADGPWRSLDEPFVYEDGPDQTQIFGPVTIPKGRLWVMGDHRNDSADSRAHCGASLITCDSIESTVPVSAVIGKAFVIAWPVSRWRTLGTPKTFTTKTGALASGGLEASALPLLVTAIVIAPVVIVRRRRRAGRRSVP